MLWTLIQSQSSLYKFCFWIERCFSLSHLSRSSIFSKSNTALTWVISLQVLFFKRTQLQSESSLCKLYVWIDHRINLSDLSASFVFESNRFSLSQLSESLVFKSYTASIWVICAQSLCLYRRFLCLRDLLSGRDRFASCVSSVHRFNPSHLFSSSVSHQRFRCLQDLLSGRDRFASCVLSVHYFNLSHLCSGSLLCIDGFVASRFFFPDEIDSLPVEQSAHAGCEEVNWPRMFEDSVPDAIAHLFAETTELSAEQVRWIRCSRHHC